MPIDVFIAYVDTYVGKQLLQQFQASPHLFTVHGCTWTEAAAQALNEEAAAALHQRQQHSIVLDGTVVSTISQSSTVQDRESFNARSDHLEPTKTLPYPSEQQPADKGQGSAAPPLPPVLGTGSLSGTASLGASQGTKAFHPENPLSSPNRDATSAGNGATNGTTGAPPPSSQLHLTGGSVHFFCRRDVTSVRRALAQCEWVVVEQRESQEVLDMLRCVQDSPFDRPKKFVLLSSFMTWYATPPLAQPGAENDSENGELGAEDGEADPAAAAREALAGFDGIRDVGTRQDADADDADFGEGTGDNDVGTDINAPYPPPPDPNSDVDEDGVAAEDAENDSVGRDPNGANDSEEDEEEGVAGASKGRKEVFSEDQYNRRVPHVKYYNWRDAEKAVAAAHHADGLPLDTYVVFAGLPYGEGEDLLEPFFRQAWCGGHRGDADDAAAKPMVRGSLPVYGDGTQCVPLMHVRDLATFTRKLLHRPLSAVPARYLFATDGARPTWRAVMESVNWSFGDQCDLVPVAPAEFPLHSHIEHFTVDLRVERGVMAALMEEMTFDLSEGDVPPAQIPAAGAEEPNLWVAEGGLRRHMERVAMEFCEVRRVTPLRIVLQGPPLAGKRFVATRLGAHYRLPHFSIDDVVDAYKACLAEKKAEVEGYKAQLLEAELARRRAIRKRRILNAFRQGIRTSLSAPNGNSEENSRENTPPPRKSSSSRRSNATARNSTADTHRAAVAAPTAAAAAATMAPLGPSDAEAASEPDAALFELTEAEVSEARELIHERIESSVRVARWRRSISEMERVLLMRMRVSGTAGGSSLLQAAGEDASSGGAGPLKKRAVAAAKPKKLTKEQQRLKEEEELAQAKEALKDAPFQDKALAIMLRWRLRHADCRTRGYILHGFPRTIEQARLAFGSEPLSIPRTEEEALNPPATATRGNRQQQQQQFDDEDEEGEADPLAGLTNEPSDESRLPDHVFILEAAENFLLDRLAAVSGQQGHQDAASLTAGPTSHEATDATEEAETATAVAAKAKADFLRRFHDHLHTFQHEFMEATYSMLSYWECAVTEPGRVTRGGRRPEVHLLTVHDTEPLVPPPAPASAYALTPPCETELTARELIGAPHYFGKTPLEIHREEVRKVRLAQEQREAEQRRQQQARQREAEAQQTETQLREAVSESFLATQRADLAALEARRAPLRDYLMESVIPLVSKGLLEVAATRPENPLEYLSEWLMRHNPNSDVFQDI